MDRSDKGVFVVKAALPLIVGSLLALVFVAPNIAPQESAGKVQPHIELGQVRLMPAMPKEHVIELLTESFSVSPWKGGDQNDTWGVAERRADERGAHPVIGYVSFEGGRLVRAGRYWPQTGSGYDVVHTVSNLLVHLREEGFTNCSVSTRKPNQPEIEHDAVLISCGSKGISVDASLSHYRGEPVTGVDIYEELDDLTPKKH
jgi:hypothetical protein